MSRSPQASRCTTKCHSATLASATSDARNWRSSVADASREWPASNWANAASVVSSARPSRPSADAFSRANSSASTSAGECFVLRWGIARSARVGAPSSTGGHRPVEPNSGNARLMHLRRSAHIVAAAAAARARRDPRRNNDDEGNTHHDACRACDHHGRGQRRLVARDPEGRDPAARRLGRRRRRARPARRHFQEARARSRDPLRPGRPGIDPGGDWRQHGYRDRCRRVGRGRHLCQGRADPHYRQRNDRGARSLLVRAGELATGNDVTSLRTRTVRVNLTSVNLLQNRRDAIVRFNRAYKETVAWMYSDPAALKHYAEYSNLPEKIVLRVRELIPKESMATERVEGIDQIMADAVAGKFIPAPLTSEQVKELLQIPN